MQPPGGRLDLLLQDTEKRRYEVELELGVDREKADNPHVRILGSQEKVLSRNTIAVRDSLPRPALADLWTVIHFLMRHFTRNNSAAGALIGDNMALIYDGRSCWRGRKCRSRAD